MIIDCISDLHGFYPELEGGDLLIVAGDLTANDTLREWGKFFGWLNSYDYKKKIIVGGNHDNFLFSCFPKSQKEAEALASIREHLDESEDFEYLCDSGTEFEYEVEFSHPASNDRVSIDVLCFEKKRLKIWGSPWTKTFPNMNPKCKAFTFDTEEELAEKWKLIPNDIDILVTHTPPWGYFDHVDTEPVGSQSLLVAIQEIRPKLCVFGHIHEGGGAQTQLSYWSANPKITKMVNASHVNEYYQPVNKPIRVIL